MSAGSNSGTFWDHLDELRGCIIRVLVVTVVLAAVAFAFKETLFHIVLAPAHGDFISYRWMGVEDFNLRLMNTGLTEQFMIHVKVALYCGLLLASPYVIYELFAFVSPALYDNERRPAVRVVSAAYLMFIIGTAVNYFIVFPLTVRFLGTYQVSSDVANMLTIQSYADTLISMSLVLGLVFELPVVTWMMAFMGLMKWELMARFRKHAFVAILVIAAVITPTTDMFTLLVVAMPIWLLYEASILIVRVTNHKMIRK
ncbi:MAG: twin-arginine translocase subunit TatC [Prevotella sp.]|nr:twin-arginine translocase subunit TatC [Prevotella sp.]